MISERAYQYSTVDMETVAKNPEEFIIPEILEACRLLWSKNIFTKMCNNYDNDESWITINTLDENNQKLFDELAKTDPVHFGGTWGGFGIKVPLKPVPGADIFSSFKPLIEMFSYQDVQRDGYIPKEDFLKFYCGCYKMVPNPEYEDIPEPVFKDYPNQEAYIEACKHYNDHHLIERTVRAVDESLMEKSFAEYLAESPYADFYDEDNERIYYNKFYYEAHLRYKKATRKLTVS